MGHDDEDMIDILLRRCGVVDLRSFSDVEGMSNRYYRTSTFVKAWGFGIFGCPVGFGEYEGIKKLSRGYSMQ